MAAITQRVSNFLGGVSKLSDDQKLPGQVKECINGYPDVTVGLTKRPGLKFIEKLKNASGTAYTGTSLDNAKWFYINRDNDTETYIGCITPKPTNEYGRVYIWNAGTGAVCTVNGIDHSCAFTITANGSSGVSSNQTNTAVTGGSGSGMTVNVTASGGVATAIAINAYGKEYKVGDTITIPVNTWGSGNPASAITATLTDYDVPYYLTGAKTNYDVLTIQDTTVITNNNVTVTSSAAPTAPHQVTRATFLVDGQSVTANNLDHLEPGGDNTKWTFTFYKPDGTSASSTMGLHGTPSGFTGTQGSEAWLVAKLVAEIPGRAGLCGYNTDELGTITAQEVNGTVQVDCVNSIGRRQYFGLKITNGSIPAQLTISGTNTQILQTGYSADTQIIEQYQETSKTVAALPASSFHNHKALVANTEALDEDNFWVKFIADDEESGTGYWEETIDPAVSIGLVDENMPWELVNTATNTFTLRPLTYTKRLAGDDLTNPMPTFVNNKIEKAFYHNNRLGFLSGNNIIFSQAGEPFNFFYITARAQTDADPIDLSCQTIRPTSLRNVLPTAQGLLLFAKNQQFMVTGGEDGVMTPKLTSTKPVSTYEIETDIDPVNNGSFINFITKAPGQSKIFSMTTRGQDNSPNVVDLSTLVSDWIPTNIDNLIVSTQSQLVIVSSQASKDVYLLRSHSTGEKTTMAAWVKWQLPGTVQHLSIDNDDLLAVTKQGSNYTISTATLSQSPEDAIIVNNKGERVNPCIDLYKAANSVVWDTANSRSKCYLPYADATDLTPVIIIAGDTSTGTFSESGFTISPDRSSDGTGPFFIVPERNLTSVASNVLVGYKYNFDVSLPRTYARINNEVDYTANLNIARMKFAVGLSGMMGFKIKSKGRLPASKSYTGDGSTTDFSWNGPELDYVNRSEVKAKINGAVTTAFTFQNDTTIRFNSAPANGSSILIYLDEWYSLNPIVNANNYIADDVPLNDQSIFTIPIHQRTENTEVRLFSDSPFPVSINSMMWEGNYSPRFYRRT